jgi:hypothetical protein
MPTDGIRLPVGNGNFGTSPFSTLQTTWGDERDAQGEVAKDNLHGHGLSEHS